MVVGLERIPWGEADEVAGFELAVKDGVEQWSVDKVVPTRLILL